MNAREALEKLWKAIRAGLIPVNVLVRDPKKGTYYAIRYVRRKTIKARRKTKRTTDVPEREIRRIEEDAKKLFKLCTPAQKKLDAVLQEVAKAVGGQAIGVQKSVRSMTAKVVRKRREGRDNYGLSDLKDHVRGAIVTKDVEGIEKAIKLLDRRFPFQLQIAMAQAQNAFGYRGIHLLVTGFDGAVNAEIQLNTEDGWKVKLKGDETYEKWRDKDFTFAPNSLVREARLSWRRFRSFWSQAVGGSLRSFEDRIVAAFSSSMGKASRNTVAGSLQSSHFPDSMLNASFAESSSRFMRFVSNSHFPSSEMKYLGKSSFGSGDAFPLKSGMSKPPVRIAILKSNGETVNRTRTFRKAQSRGQLIPKKVTVHDPRKGTYQAIRYVSPAEAQKMPGRARNRHLAGTFSGGSWRIVLPREVLNRIPDTLRWERSGRRRTARGRKSRMLRQRFKVVHDPKRGGLGIEGRADRNSLRLFRWLEGQGLQVQGLREWASEAYEPAVLRREWREAFGPGKEEREASRQEYLSEFEGAAKKFPESFERFVSKRARKEGDRLIRKGVTGYNVDSYHIGSQGYADALTSRSATLAYHMYTARPEHGRKLLSALHEEFSKRGLPVPSYEVRLRASSVVWDEAWGRDRELSYTKVGKKLVARSVEYAIVFHPEGKEAQLAVDEFLDEHCKAGKTGALEDSWHVPDMRATFKAPGFERRVLHVKRLKQGQDILVVARRKLPLKGYETHSVWLNAELADFVKAVIMPWVTGSLPLSYEPLSKATAVAAQLVPKKVLVRDPKKGTYYATRYVRADTTQKKKNITPADVSAERQSAMDEWLSGSRALSVVMEFVRRYGLSAAELKSQEVIQKFCAEHQALCKARGGTRLFQLCKAFMELYERYAEKPNITLYRGLVIGPELYDRLRKAKPGDTLEPLKDYTSWTADKTVAVEKFTSHAGPSCSLILVLEPNGVDSYRVMDLRSFTREWNNGLFAKEQELVLKDGKGYEIVSIEANEEKHQIIAKIREPRGTRMEKAKRRRRKYKLEYIEDWRDVARKHRDRKGKLGKAVGGTGHLVPKRVLVHDPKKGAYYATRYVSRGTESAEVREQRLFPLTQPAWRETLLRREHEIHRAVVVANPWPGGDKRYPRLIITRGPHRTHNIFGVTNEYKWKVKLVRGRGTKDLRFADRLEEALSAFDNSLKWSAPKGLRISQLVTVQQAETRKQRRLSALKNQERLFPRMKRMKKRFRLREIAFEHIPRKRDPNEDLRAVEAEIKRIHSKVTFNGRGILGIRVRSLRAQRIRAKFIAPQALIVIDSRHPHSLAHEYGHFLLTVLLRQYTVISEEQYKKWGLEGAEDGIEGVLKPLLEFYRTRGAERQVASDYGRAGVKYYFDPREVWARFFEAYVHGIGSQQAAVRCERTSEYAELVRRLGDAFFAKFWKALRNPIGWLLKATGTLIPKKVLVQDPKKGAYYATRYVSPETGEEVNVQFGQVNEIPVDFIRRNPDQPRKEFDQEALRDLAESIKNIGLKQPIVLRPHPKEPGKFEIVAGERRWRATKMIGAKNIKAIVEPLTDEQAAEVSLMENITRKDLTPAEEANAYKALIDRGWTIERLSEATGHAVSTIARTLNIANLLPEVQKIVGKEGGLTKSQAIELGRLPVSKQRQVMRRVVKGSLTLSQTRALVNAHIAEQMQTGMFAMTRQQKVAAKKAQAMRTMYERMVDYSMILIDKVLDKKDYKLLPRVLKGNLRREIDKLKMIERALQKVIRLLEEAQRQRELLGRVQREKLSSYGEVRGGRKK